MFPSLKKNSQEDSAYQISDMGLHFETWIEPSVPFEINNIQQPQIRISRLSYDRSIESWANGPTSNNPLQWTHLPYSNDC